jgi:pimeloyl-ACP methyl ester carboxylesterase
VLLTHCIDGKRRFHGATRPLTWKSRCGDHTGRVSQEKSSVVLLHGQPGSGSDWREVIARLPVTVQCVAADRPGYRSSPHRAAGLLGNAEIVLADLDRAGIEQAVLVGHSYGGGVALTAAALAPHRVRGLVLVASIGPGAVTGWDRLLAAPWAGPVCAVTAWSLTPWLVRAHLSTLQRIRRRPLDHDEWVNFHIWGNARYAHGAMWRTFLTEQRDFVHGIDALDTVITQVRAPSLILADPADTLIPVATAHALNDRLPGSQLQLVAYGGHPGRQPRHPRYHHAQPRRTDGMARTAFAPTPISSIHNGRVEVRYRCRFIDAFTVSSAASERGHE